MEKEKIKVLILDYDGTIIERNNKKMFDEVFSGLDKSKEISHWLRRKYFNGKNIKESIKNTFLDLKIPFDEEFLKKCTKSYVSYYGRGIITGEVKNLLKNLSKKFKLILLSGGRREYIIRELKENNLLDIFSDIITREDCLYEKPDSRLFEFVLKKHNLQSSEVLSIGNSVIEDIFPAKKIGIKTVLITHINSDIILKSINELNETLISKL